MFVCHSRISGTTSQRLKSYDFPTKIRSMKKRTVGKCHICGTTDELSYEHIPPRAAFNSHKNFIYFIKDVLGSENFPWDLSGKRGKQLQKGIGFYTLCGRCNNNTGAWYGDALVDFTYQGYRASHNKKLKPYEWASITFQEIYPLRVIKEIVAMFFSVNNPDLSTLHQDLRAFVLSKERKGITPHRYGLYLYLLRGSIARYAGLTGIGSFPGGHTRIISELAAPPFGYVLEFDPKNKRDYCDLTFFANDFDYNQKATVRLRIPVYESNTPFPSDHRTKLQIMEDYIKNKLLELQKAKP